MYGKVVLDGFIGAVVIGGGTPISETEYNEILNKIHNKPVAPDGYTYRLQDGTMEWVLVDLPPETFTEDEALVRYANELTGAHDETLEEATETLIKLKMEE